MKKNSLALMFLASAHLAQCGSTVATDLPVALELSRLTALMTQRPEYAQSTADNARDYNTILASFRNLTPFEQFKVCLKNLMEKTPPKILNSVEAVVYEIQNITDTANKDAHRYDQGITFLQKYAQYLMVYSPTDALRQANLYLENHYKDTKEGFDSLAYRKKLARTAGALEDKNRALEHAAREALDLPPRSFFDW